MTGLIIKISGGPKSGKTTASIIIEESLKRYGYDVIDNMDRIDGSPTAEQRERIRDAQPAAVGKGTPVTITTELFARGTGAPGKVATPAETELGLASVVVDVFGTRRVFHEGEYEMLEGARAILANAAANKGEK